MSERGYRDDARIAQYGEHDEITLGVTSAHDEEVCRFADPYRFWAGLNNTFALNQHICESARQT